MDIENTIHIQCISSRNLNFVELGLYKFQVNIYVVGLHQNRDATMFLAILNRWKTVKGTEVQYRKYQDNLESPG